VNRRIRRLAVALMFCFAALFVQMNLLQVGQMSCPGIATPLTRTGCRKRLDKDPTNNRAIVRDFSQPRGSITTADGVVLAKSVPVKDQFKYQREFPEGDLFGPITGYYNFAFGATGLEKYYNDELAGQTAKQQYHSLSDLFVTRQHTGDLTLTIRKDVQLQARQALEQALSARGLHEGAAVALDPRTGAILALWSDPTFDPNPLSSHDHKTAQYAKNLLDGSSQVPLLARSYRETYAPGSTMKVVTGSIGVDTGKVTADHPSYPSESAYQPPYGLAISNFGGEVCGGTLFRILAVSCNSSFAQMGLETIGPSLMVAGADKFGFNEQPPIDLPNAATSVFPTDFAHQLPLLAQGSIGQGDVRATPLEMALATAGVANNGAIMAPHLLNQVIDEQGNVVKTYENHVWKQAISPSAAATMRGAMINVVDHGTARGVFNVPGYTVGAKTGTAEVATTPATNNAWMVAWAGPTGQEPTVVVAVVVPRVPGHGNESTGAAVAGPVASALLNAAIAAQNQPGGGH
jgi:peptidoglycan glycosyltransferase